MNKVVLTRVGVAITVAVLAASLDAAHRVAADAQSPAKPFPQPYGAYSDHPYPADFSALAAAGIEQIRKGDVDGGTETLFRAAKVKIPANRFGDHLPNYELWDDIGLAACRRSDFSLGRSLLSDYRCAVDMTVHDTPCYVGAPPNAVPSAELSSLCFRTMCGDVWEPNSFRVGPAEEDIEGVQSSLQELKRVDTLIKQCRPHRKAVVR